MRARLGLSFDLLHDAGNRIGEAYGIVVDTPPEVREVEQRLGLDLPAVNGTQDWRLPMPATFVIDSAGIVRSGTVQADHARRPEPEETLAALEAALEALRD